MRAMRLNQPRPIEEAPLTLTEGLVVPGPGDDQVLVSVHVCAVCHTDLHIVEGDLTLPRLPLTPGHQVVGAISGIGRSVTQWRVGDRVGIGWMNQVCGQCDFCRRGEENLCPRATFTGLDMDGGYGQALLAHQDFVHAIPESIDDLSAAPLLCGGVIGYRSLRLSGIEAGGRLGLYGFGSSAHQAIQVARFWGCSVYVFTRSAAHRRHALELGATWAGGVDDEPPVPMDAAITFAPAGWIIPRALERLRPGGTLAINAIHMSPIPEFPYRLLYGERVVRSVANFTAQDAHDFLHLAATIPVRTEVEVFALEDANHALARLKRSEIQGAAVLRIASSR